MTTREHHLLLRALLRDKTYVRPGTLARLPTAQAQGLRSPLDLGRQLLAPLGRCPLSLLQFWARHPRGYVAINPQRHEYRPGRQPVGRRQLDGVAWVSARSLLADPRLAEPVVHLLDHLLGSDGEPGSPRLSDGAGRSAAWTEVAGRLLRQFRLGYAPDGVADDPARYFAWGVRGYLAGRQDLNTADPGLERLLHTTLFDAGFWERAGAAAP